MKSWKLVYKVAAINSGIVILIGILCGIANAFEDFALVLGIVCLVGGLLDLFLALIVALSGSREWAKGFLLAAGVLLLLSGISCGTGLSNVNFH